MRGKKERSCSGYGPDFLGYIRKTWGYFFGAVASNLVTSAGAIGAPFLLAEAMEAYTNDNSLESHFFNSTEFYWTLGLGGAITIYQGIYFLRNYFINASVIQLRKNISEDVMRKSLRLTYAENQSLENGEIHQRLSRLEPTVNTMLSSIFLGSSAGMELIAATIIVGEKYGLEFSLCLVSIALLNIGSMLGMHKLTDKPDAARIKTDEDLLEIIGDIEAGYESIKGNSKEKYYESHVISPKMEEWIRTSNKSNCLNELLPMAKNIVVGLGITVISLRALHLLYTDNYKLDDLVFIISYLIQIANSTSGADSLLKEFRISWRNFKKVMDILEKQTEPESTDEDHRMIKAIHFNHVRFFSQQVAPRRGLETPGATVQPPESVVYDENSLLVNSDKGLIHSKSRENFIESLCLGPISFELKKSQFTAIVGGSGTGKSTLTRLLFRFLDLSSEQNSGNINVQFDGINLEEDIKNLSINNLRSKICYVTQAAEILPGGLVQNVTFGDDENDRHYLEALEKVNLLHEKKAAGERLRKFSGGEKQRVNLARAFYAASKGCRVFVFDESTSALDNATQRKIMSKIHDLKRNGAIIIFVAHRLEAIKEADQIICLKKEIQEGKRTVSKIAESGIQQSTEDLVLQKSAYELMQSNCGEFNNLLNAENSVNEERPSAFALCK